MIYDERVPMGCNVTNVRRFKTENPRMDQWQLLAQFGYSTNIERYFAEKGLSQPDKKTIEFISGCVRQAEAYYSAASNAPLDIAPLLLYYGAVSLLAGISGIVTGVQPPIMNHGMKLRLPAMATNRIADAQIVPHSPISGALQQFCNVFSDGCVLTNGGVWTLMEVLGSVPDLKREFEDCYSDAVPFSVPMEVVRTRRFEFERVALSELARCDNPTDVLEHVKDFARSYLKPQISGDGAYVVVHYKSGGEEIGTHSIFGQKHLQIAHIKNGRSLTPSHHLVYGVVCLGLSLEVSPRSVEPNSQDR